MYLYSLIKDKVQLYKMYLVRCYSCFRLNTSYQLELIFNKTLLEIMENNYQYRLIRIEIQLHIII